MSVVLWSFHLKAEGVVEPPQEEIRVKGGKIRFVDVPERKEEEARKQAGGGASNPPKHLSQNRPGLPPEAETASPEAAPPKFEPLVVDPKRVGKIVAQTPPVVRDSQPPPQWHQDEEELLMYLMARAA